VSSLRIGEADEGSTVEVRLQPRSSRQGVDGVREGAIRLKVHAPPAEGRANDAARGLLADLLGVSPSTVRLKSGAKSRTKVFLVTGLVPAELRRRLEKCLARVIHERSS
jgi:uncharacterized protein (TIGR00251 family)